jgi:hypothetical protein
MRAHQTQGRGTDRPDCMRQFKAAWERFAADEANLTMFRYVLAIDEEPKFFSY